MTMPEADLYARLDDLFRDVIGDDTITLTPDTTAQDIEGWDSVTNVSLVVAIETQFKVRIRTDEVETLKNVGEMVALIQRKLG
jgi:acyl carrier protein